MAKASPHAPPDRVAAYELLLATNLEVARKGAANPYTSVNGNMFSMLLPNGRLSLRLPAAEREQFIEEFGARLTEQYGIVQKEYVEVPDAVLDDIDVIRAYFEVSYRYALSLKPKPTKQAKR